MPNRRPIDETGARASLIGMDGLSSDDITSFTTWAQLNRRFETERMVLRPLDVSDAESLFDAMKNPRVNEWIPVFEQPFDRVALRRWLLPRLARMERQEGLWYGVYHRGATVLMGWAYVGLEEELGGVELAGALSELYWGKGFIEEVGFALINDLFRAGVSHLVADCFPDNWSSMRALRALNFEEIEQRPMDTTRGRQQLRIFKLTPERWRKAKVLPLGDGLSPEDIKERRRELLALCREMKSARDYVEAQR